MPPLFRALLGLGLAFTQAVPASAQISLSEVIPNFAGVGGGFAPDYLGSRNTTWGAAPAFRMDLGGERFVALSGPFAELNLLDHRYIQAGPVLNYRFGRSGAENQQVRALGNLDPLLEAGGRVSAVYIGTGSVPFRARAGVSVMGDVTGQYGGASVLPFANIWVPLSREVFVGAGVMARFAPASHNRYYFGVSPAGAAASGMPAYDPKGGYTSITAWPALVWRFRENWALGGGMAYTQLASDAANSPIVQRGSRNQFIGGLGIAYIW